MAKSKKIIPLENNPSKRGNSKYFSDGKSGAKQSGKHQQQRRQGSGNKR